MKHAILLTIGVCVALLTAAQLAGAASAAPQAGDVLPEIILPAPSNPEHLDYLGLEPGKDFTIPRIKADVVIIEIFSMYCPHCQREAPSVNALFKQIRNDQALKDKFKLIGIGVGNSAFEVDVFRKNYKIAFPLFPDGDFKIHKMIGEVRTPFFIAVKINPDGPHRIIYAKLGGIEDNTKFIERIRGLAAK